MRLARLRFNDVTFDPDSRQVWCNEREVRLSHEGLTAAALVHGCPLITHNAADYQGIAGLVIITEP